MKHFFSRVLVAAAALPLVLGFTWLGGWWLFTLAAVGGLWALHEFYGVARPLRPVVIAGYAGLLLVLFGIKLGGLQWGAGGVVAAAALAFLLKGVSDTRQSATVSVGTTVLGSGWIAFGLGYILLIREITPHSRLIAFTVLLAVFASDTFAYYAGRLVGRHKLAPAISPGKTWEGFVAGSAAAVLASFFALYDTRHTFLTTADAIVLGAVIAVAAPVGDLFESMVKRDMNVKDAGRLLLGHGGLLDRIDSMLFASVAAYYTIISLL